LETPARSATSRIVGCFTLTSCYLADASNGLERSMVAADQ
jgi:hypothetical protein